MKQLKTFQQITDYRYDIYRSIKKMETIGTSQSLKQAVFLRQKYHFDYN